MMSQRQRVRATFGAAIRAEIGMTKLRRGGDEFAGLEERDTARLLLAT
jgi:hypothetical protein